MGELLANQQKTIEAAAWFKRAIRASPNYVETYLNLGFLQQNQENFTAARESYQKAAHLEPEGPADYFNRANAAAALGQWDQVTALLRAVVKAKPEFWQARYQLGIQLASKGEIEEAQRQFSEAIRYRPDFVPAHLHLGTALNLQGKLDRALAEYHTVLQLDPANTPAQKQIVAIEAALHQNQ